MKKRCLISVYDKTGVAEFAKALAAMDWEILSTGNTKKHLEEQGLSVIGVDEITHFPEILDGRVKTLSPYLFGGILFRRDVQDHVDTVKEHGILPIDMVVNTLYPFEETVAKEDSKEQEIIEKIDIGGPSLIRATAKNHSDCYIVTSPSQYDRVIEALKNTTADLAFRKQLAFEAFATTAAYDAAIATYFAEKTGDQSHFFGVYDKGISLRYGENPHQKARFLEKCEKEAGSFKGMKQFQGKELSYNNYGDLAFGMTAIKEFPERKTCIAIKHQNPCAVASADTLREAYKKAHDADPQSIFGGIIIFNDIVDEALAQDLTQIFLEVILAPAFSDGALKVFEAKKNLRIIQVDDLMTKPEPAPWKIQSVPGGILMQEEDTALYEKLEVVTKREPTQEEKDDMLFAWKVAKIIKSNGVVIAKDEGTLGIGLGEVNRFWAVEEAIDRAGEKRKGAVLASDAFFPFADSIIALAEAGISAVIQPGGSVKDQDSIDVADEKNMTMIFTGMRHFRH